MRRPRLLPPLLLALLLSLATPASRTVNVYDVEDARDALFEAVDAGGHDRIRAVLAAARSSSSSAATSDLVDYVDDERGGYTLLTRAAHRGRTGVVRLLLAAGAGVDVPTRKGNTPLAVAAREGAVDIVRMLVGAGASINRVNLAQMDEPCARLSNRNREDVCEPRPGTALMQAAQGGRTETMRVLLDLGADVHGVDLGGNSALSWVAKGGDTEAAELLLARGADVNWQDNSGFTSLMWAAFNAQLGLAQLLCDRGADVDVRDFLSGRNALIWAAGKGLFDIAELLVDRYVLDPSYM